MAFHLKAKCRHETENWGLGKKEGRIFPLLPAPCPLPLFNALSPYKEKLIYSYNCGEILDRALATPGPVIVEAIVDPLEPPLPPKITLEQATKFAESLAKGEPNREKIALTILSDQVRQLI